MANCNYKVNLTDIQNKYKFKIFNTGSYNDSDLRKMIESVFYALPRTTGTGTSVTLTDTAFSYMKNKLNATDTSQTGTPTPDTPLAIHTITGDNEIVVCGKNLFDKSKYQNLDTNYDYETPYKCKYIKLKPNTTYTCSFNAGTTFANALLINNKSQVNSSGFFDLRKTSDLKVYTTDNTGNLYIGKYGSNNTDLNERINTCNLQILEGTYTSETIPSYEPYQSNSVLLTLGDKEICKIGDYEDKIFKAIKGNEIYDSLASEEKATLDYGKWYLRKAIGKVVLNGSEEGWDNQYGTNLFGIAGYFNDKMPVVGYGLSNYYIYNPIQSGINAGTTNGQFVIQKSSSLVANIFIKNTDYDNPADFENWLSTHNTSVYYPLATPTNELFNDTIQDQLEDIYNNMLSYEGQTNVSQVNDDLPFNINSTAIKDLNDL